MFKLLFFVIFGLSISIINIPIVNATDCSTVTLKYNSTGECVKQLQTLLKNRGYYSMSVDGKFSIGTANAVLNYQRASHINDDAIVGSTTWKALNNSYMPTNPIPAECNNSGTRLCVSKAERKLRMYNNGTLIKTFNVRVGGFAADVNGNYRVHQTATGSYSVFKKDPNPDSARYGEGVMPWSVMFDPNMYVHYSADFFNNGYSHGSHGCVNIGSYTDAKWIYDNTPLQSKVIVY